jgi:hypothetical protein
MRKEVKEEIKGISQRRKLRKSGGAATYRFLVGELTSMAGLIPDRHRSKQEEEE